MKISRFIKNALILAFISIFAGCSNLIDSKDDSATSLDANQGKFVVSLGLKNPGTRAIRAFDYSISKIARWTLTLSDESNSESIIMTTGAQTAENSPSATYDESSGTITATKISAGTYTVTIEGDYINGSTKYKISGSAGGVAISADSSGKATILLGPKSTESGTGSILLTFTDSSSDKILSNLASSLKITLTSLSSSNTYYTTDSSDTGKSGALTFASSSLTLSESGIKSGWYKISFSAGDTYRVYLPDEPSQFVEIADDTETTATTAISVESGKVYYTDIGGKYNGLTENSRIDLNRLLTNLTEKMPEEGNIFIHKDTQLYFANTKLLNSFKDEVGKNSKKVVFYDNEGNESLIIIGDGAGSTTTTLEKTISFLSTDNEVVTFEINKLELSSNAMIYLSNVTIDASDVNANSYSSNFTMTFELAKSNDETIYTSTPFFIAGTDLSSTIKLDSSSFYAGSTDYTIVAASSTTTSSDGDKTTVYNHYVKPLAEKTITVNTYKDAQITSYLDDDAETYFDSNGDTTWDGFIPYESQTVYFELTGLGDSTYKNITSYAWYLNGKSLKSDDSTTTETKKTSFDPTKSDYVDVDGKNTVSCYFTLDGSNYVCEYKFKFTSAYSRSAAVWFDGINSSNSCYSLKQLSYSDSINATGTASTLVSDFSDADTTPLYCFDSSYNLWTGTYSNSQLTTKKYSMIVSSGLFNTTHTGSIETIEISKGTPVDIYYDKTEENIFILATNGTTGYIYEDFYAPASFSLSSDSSVTPSQIAVSNGTIYIAGSDCNIYKSTVTLDYQGEDEDNCVILGDFTKIASLNSADVLGSNYTSSGNLSVTDLQVGDGSGNDTTTLYALLREYYIYSDGYTSNFSCYSRGALVAIDTSSSTATPSVYGWTDNTTPMSYSSSISGTLYGPGETTGSSSLLYGPTHFAAVVPKKLVILDDGVVYSTVGKVKNKDSLVEFDIDEKSLSRGASVSATAVIVSGFTVSD